MNSSGDNRSSKRVMKDKVHGALKGPVFEAAFASAIEASPVSVQETLKKVVPQPYSYQLSDVRRAQRRGLSWELHPAEYFQWHQYFGFADSVLATLEPLVDAGDVVVDIGANVGFYSLVLARRVGGAGRVLAFEPNPSSIARINQHIRENNQSNVRCLGVALGETTQRSQLTDFGGGDSGKFSLRRDGDAHRSLEVEVCALDDVVATEGLSHVDLIKIDVEGYEPEVLLGAQRTLERFQPFLCVELTPRWYEARATMRDRAFGQLSQLGYRFFEISSVASSFAELRQIELRSITEGQRNVLGVPLRPRPFPPIIAARIA